MPQYQGIWTLEQQAQALTNQQWVTDPNFKNTTLLLQADGTGSGSQNQTFLDGSTNNFYITRNGNTTQGSFSPFSQAPGYWSNYFNGSSTISMASNSAFNILAYDTFECWVNFSALGTSNLIAGRDADFWLAYNHTGIGGTASKFVFAIYNGSAWQAVSSTTTPVVGVWYHILGVKDNTTLRMYVNGIQENTATFSGSPSNTATTVYIASNNNTENSTAYISNLRLITGASNAVFPYSGLTTGAAFTPQTTPLTAVSSTQLLTCQSNRFVDNSTNAFALTAVSAPSVQAFGPFAPALQWTPTVVGGSGYFDGTGDYLTGPNASGGDFSTGNFTISCWFYPTVLTGGTDYGVLSYSDGAWNGWQLLARATTRDMKFEFLTGSAANSTITGGTIALNAWNYVVVTRSGSTVNMYVNSTAVAATTTNSSAYGVSTSKVNIGADRLLGVMTGYISNTKLVKQANAPASIPTAPDTATTNTSLLLNFTNAGIYDGKMGNVLETVGDAQVSTSPVKYGSGSIKFDGTGDYLSAPNSPSFVFGTSDFTIEFWINTSDTAGGLLQLTGGTTGYWQMSLSSSSVVWQSARDTTNLYVISATSILNTQWHHVAVCRANGINRLFFDGVVATAVADTTNYSGSAGSLYIGRDSVSNDFLGYLDDLRITKGIARYIANFTPPQQALPRQ